MLQLIEKFIENEAGSVCLEGERGVKAFTALTKELGYSSVDSFLSDNSGAITALLEWIASARVPEWKAALLTPENAIGNCVTDFDADGNCTNDDLPWSDATEFAQCIDEHGDDCVVDDITVVYDPEDDIHWFYQTA